MAVSPKIEDIAFCLLIFIFLIRRQIRVINVLVHENFTNTVNDIALLKLGEIKIHVVIHVIKANLTYSQKTVWIYQSSALSVFPTSRQTLLVMKGTSMVSSTTRKDTVSPFFHLRLGRHWSPRDLHRQAARDSSSHCPDQQL